MRDWYVIIYHLESSALCPRQAHNGSCWLAYFSGSAQAAEGEGKAVFIKDGIDSVLKKG